MRAATTQAIKFHIMTTISTTFETEYEEYKRRLHTEQGQLIKRGMKRKAEAGGVTGKAPLGYVNRRRGYEAWVEIDPVKGPLVQKSFELAATGSYSLRQMQTILTQRGLTARIGKPVSLSVLHQMLRNPFYAGMVVAGGATVTGKHAALVPPELFWKAQGALGARSEALL